MLGPDAAPFGYPGGPWPPTASAELKSYLVHCLSQEPGSSDMREFHGSLRGQLLAAETMHHRCQALEAAACGDPRVTQHVAAELRVDLARLLDAVVALGEQLPRAPGAVRHHPRIAERRGELLRFADFFWKFPRSYRPYAHVRRDRSAGWVVRGGATSHTSGASVARPGVFPEAYFQVREGGVIARHVLSLLRQLALLTQYPF